MAEELTQFGQNVTLKIAQRLASIEIQREQSLNALNTDVLEGLYQAFFKLRTEYWTGGDAYQKVGAVVLKGQGKKAFVAGADIKEMKDTSANQRAEFVACGQRLMREIERCPLSVLAVVQGFALGGGCELALACDIIVAGQSAKFGQPEVNLGLIPGFGGTQRLCARVGIGAAKRLILTAETIDGTEAQRLGLVDYLVADDELETKCEQLTSLLLTKSPQALAASKRSIQAFYQQQMITGLEYEVEHFLEVIETKQATEGLNAFAEKRKAEFVDK